MSENYEINNPRIIREEGWKNDQQNIDQVENIENIYKKCRSNCKTCPDFVYKNTFKSTVTGREYSIINNTNERVNCKFQNIIYLLTCKGCSAQYVGETAQKCHKRMNVHRKGKFGCEYLIQHFSECCINQSFLIQIIEKFSGNGYKNGEVDEQMRNKRLEKEDRWMKTLRTIYPYGLNEKCKHKNIEQETVAYFTQYLDTNKDPKKDTDQRRKTINIK